MNQKMRILLVALAMLISVEARAQDWGNGFNNPGFGNGRGNNYGYGPAWAYPVRQNYLQNIALGSNVEWVCRNSQTNDVMIIAVDNTQQTSNRGPWQWQNLPLYGHRHQQDGHHWTQPIIVIQQGTKDSNNEGSNQTPFPTTTIGTYNDNNNNQPTTTSGTHSNDDQPQTTPQYHGGEGLIDIRFGKNSA
ncbi:uncharacterized protein LOC116840679 [Odontomachus brunneus]|uniref:uncharacterized protein LOC116840679 n=1 Tax=Odontomachus brunneus TaxID=486640 RepID=UPI0013F2369C|nr:uncharacterized protein LOC116840679 [Odontomachus brunneus]